MIAPANGRVALETVEGTVEAVNERGIKINAEWFNRSQFRPVTLPDVGAHVRLEVDGKGYIRDLEVMTHHDDEPVEIARPETGWTQRDVRLQVLEFAVKFGASRPDCKSADVLRIADAWLAWVQTGD